MPTRYAGYPGVATVNGTPYQSRRSGSGAHLGYMGMGSRYGSYHSGADDDIVPGPQDEGTFAKKAVTPEAKTESKSPSGLELPSTFWGLTGNDPMDMQNQIDEAEERILANSMMASDPDDDDPVGANRAVISDDTMLRTLEVIDSARDNARFDEISIMHGVPAAISFCSISEMITDLDHTPLLEEAALEAVGIMTADQRVRFLKDIFIGLPERHKMQIQTNGLS